MSYLSTRLVTLLVFLPVLGAVLVALVPRGNERLQKVLGLAVSFGSQSLVRDVVYAETVQRNKELADINARLQSTQQQLIQSEKLAAVGQAFTLEYYGIVVRTGSAPESVVPDVRTAVHAVDPNLALFDVYPMEQVRWLSYWMYVMWGTMFGVLGGGVWRAGMGGGLPAR